MGGGEEREPQPGPFFLDELTDLVEEAVLAEFERLAERGGVLGAMETGYQRGRIQDESLRYEHMKHDGSHAIVGVNTFLNPEPPARSTVALQRSSEQEKQSQLDRLRAFQTRHADIAPAMLERLRRAVIANENVFELLMDAVRCCSLGQITSALRRRRPVSQEHVGSSGRTRPAMGRRPVSRETGRRSRLRK